MKAFTALFTAAALTLTAGLAQARDLGPDEALKLRDAGTIQSFEKLNAAALAQHAGGKIGVLLEVNCETDFVAREQDFQQFATALAKVVLEKQPARAVPLQEARASIEQYLQNRGRQVVVLVRLDLGGAPHRNPDDVEVPAPHLHVYREGYGDKWAMAVPRDRFRDLADVWTALEDFLRFCNVTQPPHIERGLFT